ncbi:LysR family transcriptional regulator, partial [Rhizobium johnstonii]|uniref:helix-turn-helix domain-containing protein n=1 Tax=Rhizobium johnstonii TaxID=3019933 RepID=UPI003F9CF401
MIDERFKTIPLNGLQAFEAVGRCGGVTAAALELNGSSATLEKRNAKEAFDFVNLLAD